ncbi:MAG TPA: GatB/YqeY domain-containing protein [Gammaproteobacteria bacterium]|nr:GatB/YqeY domain-containing protein [Gammaproteobacteria bacterium]
MSLKDQITSDMKEAMKAGAKERLAVIRLILAAVKQKEVDERITLDDAQLLTVLEKMLKQRRESVTQFLQGNRKDLADKEEAEIKVIQAYMPAQLSDAELDKLVAEAVAQSGAASVKDMGKVMGILKPKVAGKADMGAVSAKIKAKLGG